MLIIFAMSLSARYCSESHFIGLFLFLLFIIDFSLFHYYFGDMPCVSSASVHGMYITTETVYCDYTGLKHPTPNALKNWNQVHKLSGGGVGFKGILARLTFLP